jgi:hypothetical protein
MTKEQGKRQIERKERRTFINKKGKKEHGEMKEANKER